MVLVGMAYLLSTFRKERLTSRNKADRTVLTSGEGGSVNVALLSIVIAGLFCDMIYGNY